MALQSDPRNDDTGNRIRKKLTGDDDPRYFKTALYVTWTAAAVFVIYRLLDNLPLFLGRAAGFIGWLGVVLKPLVIGFVLAYLLYPLTGFIERQLDRLKGAVRLPFIRREKSSRPAATLLTCVLILVLLIILFSAIISTVTREVKIISFSDLDSLSYALANTLNSFSATLQTYLERLNFSSDSAATLVRELGNYVSDWLRNFALGILSGLRNVTGLMSQLIFSTIFGIYFLLDGEGIRHYWNRVFRAFSSEKVQSEVYQFLGEADRVFSGYIRGQVIDAAFMASVVSIGLSLTGVRYAIIIGVLTGIGNLIPYVGPFVAYTSTIFVSLLDWNPRRFLVAIVFIFLIQTIDGNVVNPKLLSSNINIHPVLVIVCLIIGGAVGGFFGMIVAVPMGALAKIYFEKGVEFRLRRKETKSSGKMLQ